LALACTGSNRCTKATRSRTKIEYCTFEQLLDILRPNADNCVYVQLSFATRSTQGDSNMKQLQAWFNLIAGVCHEEQERLAIARAIFAERGPDLAALETPACWRRAVRRPS
jgi:hypothetical protein